jgi:hypothetical protein
MMPTPNDEVAKRVENQIAHLRHEVKSAADVVVRIPDWDPVGLDEGLQWMRCVLAEGFRVESRVTWAGDKATVWMKAWEFGQSEP